MGIRKLGTNSCPASLPDKWFVDVVCDQQNTLLRNFDGPFDVSDRYLINILAREFDGFCWKKGNGQNIIVWTFANLDSHCLS